MKDRAHTHTHTHTHARTHAFLFVTFSAALQVTTESNICFFCHEAHSSVHPCICTRIQSGHQRQLYRVVPKVCDVKWCVTITIAYFEVSSSSS
jgi:hypothetical protein